MPSSISKSSSTKQSEQANTNSFLNPNIFSSESSRDPVAKLADILANSDLGPEEKQFLVQQHKTRFKNRRTMAYMSLSCLMLLFLIVLIGVWKDGMYMCDPNVEICRKGILATMNDNSNVIVWIAGFFTSIVAAYYGATIIRPSS